MTTTDLQTTDTDQSPRQMLLVLGMHRSGTSALSGMLHHLGCAVPATLIPASENNPAGYFESRVMQEFDDRLLTAARSSWRDWRPLGADWSAAPAARGLLPEAVELLQGEFGGAPLTVLKDPRICRMVPFWSEAAARAGYEVLPVLTHRNPLEVAKSLQKRNKMETGEVMLLWLRHVLEAEAATRGMRRHVTSYASLLRNWVGVATGLQERLGIALPGFDAAASEQVESFLTGDLRHFDEVPEKVTGNPTLSDWVRVTYDVFERWSAAQETEKDYPALDRILAEFNAAVPAFDQVVGAPGDSRPALRERVGSLQAELEAAQKQTETLRERLTGAEAKERQEADRAEALRAELTETETALHRQEEGEAELQDKLRELENALSQSESALAQRRLEADQAAEQLQAVAQEKAAAQARIDALEQQVSEHQHELGETAQMVAEAEAAHRSRLAEEAARRSEEAESWKGQVEALTRELSELRSAIEAEREDLAGRAASLERDVQRQHQDLGQLAALVCTAQTERDAQAAERDRLAAEATGLAGERDRLAVEGNEMRETARRQRDEIAFLTSEISSLRNSTSWRLTLPLRALVDALRGNR